MDKSNVEDIFRLSEPQEALLLHLVQQGAHDSGFLQLRATLLGLLQPELFEGAWQQSVARHPMLRASVHWKGLKHPVHVIARHAAVPFACYDWRHLGDGDREARLNTQLQQDRAQGLDVGTAPVMRVTVIRESENRHTLIWTCHHVLLDGWSGALVLDEVLERYQSLVAGSHREMPRPGSFRDYVRWARSRDEGDPEGFWRTRLGGYGGCCLAGDGGLQAPGQPVHRDVATVRLAQGPLEEWARTHRVTVSTLLFGCWALLLHARTGSERPVFGVTLSGRAGAFDCFESMVGMFANTLPLPLRVEPGLQAAVWFRQVLRQQHELQPFEHVSLGRVLQWARITPRRPLFDSLVVHANYPRHRLGVASGEVLPAAEGLRLADFQGAVTSAYPVTLVIKPERELRVELLFDTTRVGHAVAGAILHDFQALVEGVRCGGSLTIGEVLRAAPHAAAGDHAGPARVSAATPQVVDPREYELPADAMEAQLMRIFDDLIDGISQIGRDDNFFELGGDSLLLPRLIERVEQDFGVTLPLGVIFEAPTIKALAAAMRGRGGKVSWQSLVGIRESGSRLPLYLVHGVGGEIGYFYNLVQYLHPEQPVYGLQPSAEPQAALERMASHYLADIRRRQPTGPYLVGGYCLGGCVAFEMARQLVEAGESVPLVAIIDSASPGTRARVPSTRERIARLASGPPRRVLDTLKARVRRAAARITRRSGTGEQAVNGIRVPRAFQGVAARHRLALREYVPRPLDADVWLFRSENDRFERDLGWTPLVRGRLSIEMVPGHHSDVLKEPHLPHTARKLAAVLDALAGSPLASSRASRTSPPDADVGRRLD